MQGILPLDGSRAIRLNHSLPLADMQSAARRVGAFITTSKLTALSHHSIQDLETWDDADEASATSIATSIAKNTKITGVGDDAQLLARRDARAAANAGLYKQATALL